MILTALIAALTGAETCLFIYAARVTLAGGRKPARILRRPGRRTVAALLAGVTAFTFTAAFRTLPPCAEEDGSGGPVPCLWDASARGNHVGNDVIVWTTP